MGDFNNYSFGNVNVIYGVLELEGFADGDDVVDINPDESTPLYFEGSYVRSHSHQCSC